MGTQADTYMTELVRTKRGSCWWSTGVAVLGSAAPHPAPPSAGGVICELSLGSRHKVNNEKKKKPG